MNDFFRYKPGDLRKKAQQSTILGAVIFESADEPTVDVEVVTLKQHLLDIATDEAWAMVPPSRVEQTADELVMMKHQRAKEFVSITPDKITVGVNTKSVDDDAVGHAIMLLTNIEDLTQPQRQTFGEMVQVYGSSKDVQ